MTDHAKDAQKIVEQTLKYVDDNSEALVNISAAQVAATLALVEQQRIANLIALIQSHDIRFDHDAKKALSVFNPGAEISEPKWNLRPEIKEALGL